MRTVIVCDDNVAFCDLVERYLQKQKENFDIRIIKFYAGDRLWEYCRDNAFDIIFLGIELSKDKGLEIAKSLKEINPRCFIIYISFYDDYYADMVQVQPFRYIYKDLSDIQVFENELEEALSDAVKRLNAK